jgi:hypothetical protein
MTEKIYIFQGKEKVFDNGGSQIKLSTPIEELEKLIAHQRQQGDTWININICQRKAPSEKGMTHYGVLDTWKPTPQSAPPANNHQVTHVQNNQDEFDDDVPF